MTGRGLAISALMSLDLLIGALAGAGARAHPLPETVGKAAAVLDRHCAICHQAGRTSGRAPDRFANVLRLDSVARDESLVLPRRPDASRLYQRMLGVHPAPATGNAAAGGKGPSPEEIEAVRDWIEALPSRKELCGGRAFVSPSTVSGAMRDWLGRLDAEAARQVRFISLVDLSNACVSDADIETYRDAVGYLLNRLSRNPRLLRIEAVGDGNALLALSLSDMQWSGDGWQQLVGGAPRAEPVAVPAALLAARALAGAGPEGTPPAAGADIAALAREATVDVGLYRAAAEAGLGPGPFAERLRTVRGDDATLARRLLQGVIGRKEWQRLRRTLSLHEDGWEVLEESSGTQDAPPPIDLALWTDSPEYEVGSLASFSVSASRSCHLTLINVDRYGNAAVLFPNDLEQDNAIAPGVTVEIPGRDAAYQLRYDRPGTETVVAICQRHARRPQGISFDYEKQRFAILGNWRAFLRTATEREAEIKRSGERRSRRRAKADAAPIEPGGPAIEARAAIAIEVVDAPRPAAAPAP